MAGYVRLQPLTQLSASAAQRVEAAVDLGDFGQVTAQVRVSTAGSAGSVMHLQHAALLEEDAFTDCAAIPLEVPGSQVVLISAPLRYLRWRATLTGAAATFLVDLVGREGSSSPRWRPLQAIKVGCAAMDPMTFLRCSEAVGYPEYSSLANREDWREVADACGLVGISPSLLRALQEAWPEAWSSER